MLQVTTNPFGGEKMVPNITLNIERVKWESTKECSRQDIEEERQGSTTTCIEENESKESKTECRKNDNCK